MWKTLNTRVCVITKIPVLRTGYNRSARKDQPSGHFYVSSPLRGEEAAGANLVRLSLRLLNLLGGELHTGV